MVTQIYDFTTPGNYQFDSNKMSVSGKAQLILEDLANLIFNQDFASGAGFTFDDPTKAEVVGGKLQQKDQVPLNTITWATYTTSVNLNWAASGSLVPTLVGPPVINGNRLECFGGIQKHAQYDNVNFASLGNTLAIKMKWTPNYSGSPPANRGMIELKAPSTNFNRMMLFHGGTGAFRITTYSATGVPSHVAANLGAAFSVTSGQTYEIELNITASTGIIELYIDGVYQGATPVIPFTRDGATVSYLYVGGGTTYVNTDHAFEDLILFDTVQHSGGAGGNYTPGYTLPEGKYVETFVTLPSFIYSGIGNIQSLDGFTVADANSPRYIVNGEYWNGAAWVASDNSYAQASSSAQVNTNIGSLTVADTVIVKVVFPDQNNLGEVDDLDLEYTGQLYPTSNPTIKHLGPVNAGSLTSFAAVLNAPAGTEVRFTAEVDGQEKYWSGLAWVNSNQTLAQTNTLADFAANITTLITTNGNTIFAPIVYLNSDGSATPDIDTITVIFTFDKDPAVTLDFQTPANYSYDLAKIKVLNSKADLILEDFAVVDNKDMSDETGFGFGSELQFNHPGGGIDFIDQVDQRPTRHTFGAAFNRKIDISWKADAVSASLVGTAFGGASIVSNRLALNQNDLRYVSYDRQLYDNAITSIGFTIRVLITPNYSGTPASDQYLFSFGNPTNNNTYLAIIHQTGTGFLKVVRYSNTGVDVSFGSAVFVPVSGTEYEIELGHDVSGPNAYLFIDGVQQGATDTQVWARDPFTDWVNFYIGTDRTATATSNFELRYFLAFNGTVPEHTSNYTPGYMVHDGIYAEVILNMPQHAIADPPTDNALRGVSSFVATYILNGPAKELKFAMIDVDANLLLYWDGAAWQTLDLAGPLPDPWPPVYDDDSFWSTASVVAANLSTLPAIATTSENFYWVAIYDAQNGTTEFHNMAITWTELRYSTANDIIRPITTHYVAADELKTFLATIVVAGSDAVKFTLNIDGVEKYWDGAAWSTSSGYAQSNTSTEINSNLSSLNITLGAVVTVTTYLHSDAGLTTPEIELWALDYDPYGIAEPDPNLCEVHGRFRDIGNNPMVGVTVRARLRVDTFVGNKNFLITMQEVITTTDVNGYWDMDIIRSSELNGEVVYDFQFIEEDLLDQPIEILENTIPDNETAQFDDLGGVLVV
jgi:hypothetical protein